MVLIVLLVMVLVIARRSLDFMAGLGHPGSLDLFEPEIQCRSHLFCGTVDEVMESFRSAIAGHPRMRIADERPSEVLVDLRPTLALRGSTAFTFRLRFSDVGCGTEMSASYRRKVRWHRRDERLVARTEGQIRQTVQQMGLAELI